MVRRNGHGGLVAPSTPFTGAVGRNRTFRPAGEQGDEAFLLEPAWRRSLHLWLTSHAWRGHVDVPGLLRKHQHVRVETSWVLFSLSVLGQGWCSASAP